jgi:hypothetical protein
MLALNNSNEINEAKIKFNRQREILPLAKLVLTYKQELGING